MTEAFDPRIVRIGLEINGETKIFEGLDIRISGQKYASPIMNQCTIKISNLNRDQRNYVLTKASPIIMPGKQRQQIKVTVDIGRESYGTFRLFEGYAYTSIVTPPPDIGIVLCCLTQGDPYNYTIQNSQNSLTSLREIAQSIANQNGYILEFQAQDKNIANYSFTGRADKQIEKLQQAAGVRAFVDNSTLVVIDVDGYRGNSIYEVSLETGMVGIPQANESGVIVKTLIKPGIFPGTRIKMNSKINPSVNGDTYSVARMSFEIASRDVPFFYTLICDNKTYSQGTT